MENLHDQIIDQKSAPRNTPSPPVELYVVEHNSGVCSCKYQGRDDLSHNKSQGKHLVSYKWISQEAPNSGLALLT